MNMNDLIKKYIYLVDRVMSRINEKDEFVKQDLRQEALVGLWRALITYEEEKNKNFEAYACLVMRRRVLNELKRLKRDRDKQPDHIVGFNEMVGNTELTYEEVIGQEDVRFDRDELKKLDIDFIKVCINHNTAKERREITGMSRVMLNRKINAEKRKLKESID